MNRPRVAAVRALRILLVAVLLAVGSTVSAAAAGTRAGPGTVGKRAAETSAALIPRKLTGTRPTSRLAVTSGRHVRVRLDSKPGFRA